MEDWKDEDELEIQYHGTKFKKTADKIMKEGFSPYSYFTAHLDSAIAMGGKYVFAVVFLKRELPDYWQTRCEHGVSPNRIVSLEKFSITEEFRNKKLMDVVFDNALELGRVYPYVFAEDGRIDEILRERLK